MTEFKRLLLLRAVGNLRNYFQFMIAYRLYVGRRGWHWVRREVLGACRQIVQT